MQPLREVTPEELERSRGVESAPPAEGPADCSGSVLRAVGTRGHDRLRARSRLALEGGSTETPGLCPRLGVVRITPAGLLRKRARPAAADEFPVACRSL